MPREKADLLLRDLIVELQKIHDTCNIYDPKSEVSQLNNTAAGTYFQCSEHLWQLLMLSEEAWQLSDAAFDISISPLMKLWGFGAKRDNIPSDEEIQETLKVVGFDKLLFDKDKQSVAFSKAGMSLDFGGIAKGYALDICKELIEKNGGKYFLVNLGGNIYSSEKLPAKHQKKFQIALRDPQNKKQAKILKNVQGKFIATSANYERSKELQGRKISHILDPRTGLTVDKFSSVTAITSEGVWSDVFSTAIFVGGLGLAEKIKKEKPDCEFIIVE